MPPEVHVLGTPGLESFAARDAAAVSRRTHSISRPIVRLETSLAWNAALLALPVLAILVNGYEYGTHDHAHYIPEVLRLADPTLFPNDYLFDEPSGECTYWIPCMALLSRWWSLEVICLVGHCFFHYILFAAVYHISLNIFHCRLSALLAVLLLLVSKEVGGTSMHTVESYFAVRTAGVAMAFTAVLFLMTERIGRAAFFCGVTFLIHPLIAVPLVIVMAIQVGRRFVLREFRGPLLAASIFVLTVSPLLWRLVWSANADFSDWKIFGTLADPHQFLVYARAGYIYLTNWEVYEVAGFFGYFVLLAGVLGFRFQSGRLEPCEQRILEIVAACLLLVVAGFALTEWHASRLAVQLQLYRCFYLVYYLGTIYAAHLLVSWSRNSHEPARSLERVPLPKRIVSAGADWGLAVLVGLLLTHEAHAVGIVLLLVILLLVGVGVGPRRPNRAVFCGAAAVLLTLVFAFRDRLLSPHEAFMLLGVVAAAVAYTAAQRVTPPRLHSATFRIGFVTLAAVLLLLLSVFRTYSVRHLFQLPGVETRGPWAEVGQWCQEHTRRDAVFIVPPQSHGFRIHANRSVVSDWKDGAKVMFSQEFAYSWHTRMNDLAQYENLTERSCLELAEKYGASYVVTGRQQRLGLPTVYQNDQFTVYEIRGVRRWPPSNST